MNEKNLVALIGKVETFGIETRSINTVLNELKRQFDEFHKANYASKNDLNSAASSHIKTAEAIKSSMEDLLKRQHSLSEQLADLKSECQFQEGGLRSVKDSMQTTQTKISSQMTEMASQHSENQSYLSRNFNALRAEIADLMDKAKKEIASYPKSIIESNERLAAKVEMAQMDAQNVALKFSNLETQLRIFDRRLENLDIRIKKIELAAQK